MFKVKFDVTLAVKGCPKSGLPAVDYRREHGLPEEPSDQLRVRFEGTDESVCRRAKEYLDDDANLVLEATNGNPNWRMPESAKALVTRRDSYGYVYSAAPAVDAGVLKAFLADPMEGALALIDHLAAAAAEDKAAAEKAKADREAVAARDREEQEQKAAAAKAHRDAEVAARKKAIAEGQEKLRAWVTEHGTELVLARLENGYEWVEEAQEAYANWAIGKVKEVGVWVQRSAYDGDGDYVADDTEDYRTPTLHQIEVVRRLKKAADELQLPVDAALMTVTYKREDDDEDGYGPDEEKVERVEVMMAVTTPDGGDVVRYYEVPVSLEPAKATA